MLLFKCKTLLSRLKKKAFAELEQELLHLTNDRMFKLTLGINRIRLQPQEFQGNWIFDDILRLTDDLSFACEAHNAFLVSTQS